MPSQLWFRARRYGWGWAPATWQGWAVLAVYVIAVLAWAAYLISHPDLLAGLHGGAAAWFGVWPVLLPSAIVVGICWLKGERPR